MYNRTRTRAGAATISSRRPAAPGRSVPSRQSGRPDSPAEARHNEAPQILTVGALARSARLLLEERFAQVWVEGELSSFRRPGSGHWYFTLKDENAQISCAMFAGSNRRVRFPVREGDQVLIRGRISLYEPRGNFQLIAEHMEPAGEGALRAAFEALKARLEAEGLFDEARKQALPQRPARIAVISSATGAAIRDLLHTIERRYPALEVWLLPVAVQGERAGPEIVAALEQLAALPVELAILTRGGGSLEDLWAFNLEPVARAIAACPVPIVSAVGHQIDFTIADFVADLRAATPTAAAELITPDGAALLRGIGQLEQALESLVGQRLRELTNQLEQRRLMLVDPRRELEQQMRRADELDARLRRALLLRLQGQRQRLTGLWQRLKRQQPRRRLDNAETQLVSRARRLTQAQHAALKAQHQRLASSLRTLDAVSPSKTLERGFAAVLTEDGSVLRQAADAQPGDRLSAYLAAGRLSLTVTAVDADATLTTSGDLD